MNDILVIVKTYGDWVIYAIALWAAVSKIVKPIRGIQQDTELLLWGALTRDHDYYTKLGYCPVADKKRLVSMHKRYRERGLNHLADDWENDIISLPDCPGGA